MFGTYILDANGEPVLEPDVIAWAKWFEASSGEARRVARDWLSDGAIEVSTVFLGCDHTFFSSGLPLLWETMIFAFDYSDLDNWCWRYSSRQAAERGHRTVVRWVRRRLRREPSDLREWSRKVYAELSD